MQSASLINWTVYAEISHDMTATFTLNKDHIAQADRWCQGGYLSPLLPTLTICDHVLDQLLRMGTTDSLGCRILYAGPTQLKGTTIAHQPPITPPTIGCSSLNFFFFNLKRNSQVLA